MEDSAISRLSSSGPASSSEICSGRTRSSRRIAFEVALRATMKGRKPIENPCRGRAMTRIVRSAWTIDMIFGTCSPRVTCSDVVTT